MKKRARRKVRVATHIRGAALLVMLMVTHLAHAAPSCVCKPGLLVARCEETGPVCVPCPPNRTMPDYNRHDYCYECSPCTSKMDQVVYRQCTSTEDTQCRCRHGYYLRSKSDNFCNKHTLCQPGYKLITKGDHVTDNQCGPCEPGTYLPIISNNTQCLRHRDCQLSGLKLAVAGTSTTDSICTGINQTLPLPTTTTKKSAGYEGQYGKDSSTQAPPSHSILTTPSIKGPDERRCQTICWSNTVVVVLAVVCVCLLAAFLATFFWCIWKSRRRDRRAETTADYPSETKKLMPRERKFRDHKGGGRGFTVATLGSENNWAFKDVGNWGTLKWLNQAVERHKVTIALVDSGVRLDHPFLRDWEGNFIKHISCIPGTRDDAALVDPTGHGTFMAGIITHMLLEAKDVVEIINIKAIDDETRVSRESFSRALEQLCREHDVDIVCLAFGYESGQQQTPEEQDLLARLAHRKVMIAAASNIGVWRPDGIAWPARKLIAVGSHDEYGNRSRFSPRGESLHVLAPGEKIESVNAAYCDDSSAGETRLDSGTSFAAAYVTAVVAHFLLQLEPRMRDTEPPAFNMTSTDVMKAVLRLMARDDQHSVEGGYGPLNPNEKAFSDDDAFRNIVKQAQRQN